MEVQYQRFNISQGGNCPVTPLPLPQSLYGRTLARSYGHVSTKFSRLDGLPKFLTHGAPLARFARWSSAKNVSIMIRATHRPSDVNTFQSERCFICYQTNQTYHKCYR